MKSEHTQLSPKGGEREDMLVKLPDALERGADHTLKLWCKNLPRIRANERDGGRAAWPTAHHKTPQSWQTREGKKAARDNKPFFHRENSMQQLNLSACCCQNGEDLTNVLSTPAPFSLLLRSHLWSLAATQWCSSDWNSHDPSSLFLPGQWTEWACSRGLNSVRVAGHKISDRSMQPETGKRKQQEFLPIRHWGLPDQVKSPHATLSYLKLLKLLEYKLSFKASLSKEEQPKKPSV